MVTRRESNRGCGASARGVSMVEYVFGVALILLLLVVFGDILLRAIQTDHQRSTSSFNNMLRQPFAQ